jgi:predicted porin
MLTFPAFANYRSAITVAVLALCASSASAQSTVSIYGLVDAGIQAGHTGGSTTTRVEHSSVAPSRIGFQGTEDLGGGLQAIFRLENGFAVDTGTISNNGALFGREAWVGLKGSFGQVQAGVNYTPLFISYLAYSQGSLNAIGWGNAVNNFVYIPVVRASNSVRYTSPTFANWTVRAFYALGNEHAAGQPEDLGKTASLAANYKNGAFAMDVDYLTQNYAPTATLTTATPVSKGRYYLVGASYDFGPVKPAFLYQKHTGDADAAAAIPSVYANPNGYFYEINALIKAGLTDSVLVSYGAYHKDSGSSGNAKSYAVRYDHPLSKRTGVYAGLSRVSNESAATFTASNAGSPGIPVAAGDGINSAVVGVLHRF